MPLRSFHELEREMNAKGFTPEERAQVEADYKRTLREGIPGENLAGEMRNPTGADRVQAAGLLTGVLKSNPDGTTTAAPPREPTPTDPGLIESLRSGFRESPMADYLRKNNPDLVSIGEPGPFQPAPGAKGILENLLHQAGRFGGQPLVIAGGAAGALPLAASMAAQRAWEGSEAGETPGEMARHATEEGALGLAMGKAGSRMRQAAEVTPASVRAVARQVLPLAAEAETMGAGGEAIQSAEEGRAPSPLRAAEGTQGGLALMGAARVLHGIMGAAGTAGARRGPMETETYTVDTPSGPMTVEHTKPRGGPRIQPANEPSVTETGAGAGSTPPGPGGAETPPSEASEQPRWVEEEGGEGTGAGSTPPGAVEAVSPASAGGPSLSEEGVGRVLGMGLMRALDSGYVEVDPAGGFTLTDAGLSVVEGRGTGGEAAPPPSADLAAQMETAQRLPVPAPGAQPPPAPVAEPQVVPGAGGRTPMPPSDLPQAGVPSLADRIRAFAQPQFPAAAPVPGATGVPAVVPGQGVRTVAEAAGPGLTQVPEETIPRGVPPSTRPQPPVPGPPTTPLPARPEGLGTPPDLGAAAGPAAGEAPAPPEQAPAPAAGTPSADVVGQLLMKARRLSSTARTVQDKNFYAGQAQAFEQLLATLRAGEPPGKAVAVAGAAPGPPPSEAPAPPPRRPTTVAPTPLAPRPTAPVEESRELPPVVPPGPVEPPHPAPGPGAVPEPEPAEERPPTRDEHIAELQEALQDARREIATEQNPRGEPLSGEDIESAHQFAAELESRLRALGVTPPGMPVLAPGKPVEARPSGKTAVPPTETPPGQPEAPAPPSRRAPVEEPHPPTTNLADQPWKWDRGVADPPVEEQVAMARLREDDQPAKQAARKLLLSRGWSPELVDAVEAGKVPLPDPRRGLTVDHSLQASMRIARDYDKGLRRSQASALAQGKLRWADATGKKIGRIGPWRELDLWRTGRPTTAGPPFPARGGGKSVTLGTGLGALGDFGTEDAQTAAIRREAEAARQNPAVAKTLDTIRDEHEPTWRERLRKTATFDELYRRVVDRADPLKRAIQTMTEKPPAEWDPYTLQALAQGRAHGVTEDWLKYQPRDYHGKPVEGVKSLADIIRPFSADSDLANAWLKAKHALEVKAEGKEPGLDSDTARATIAALDSPRFRQLSTDARAYTAAMRNYLQEMLKPEVRQWLGEHYPDYVPFHRLLGEDENSVPFTGGKAGAAGKGFVDLSNPVKRLEGSERDTRSPIAALMADTGRVIRAVEANRVGLAMAETLGRDPATRSLVRKITQKELDAARADAPIVQVYSHGKRIPLELDPTMYTIAKALDRRTLGTVEKVLAWGAGKLRRGATNTPEFIPANWTRDQFTAFITMGVHPWRSIEGIAHALKADGVYQDWLAAGGDQAGWVALSNGNLQTKLADLYKNPSRFPKNTLLHPFQLLGAVSKLVEEGTRIGAFEAQRERMPAGTPYERSLVTGGYASREATVNFQRIGADMEALNAIIPFFNPGIQGPNRIVRAVRENPVGTLAKITAAVTLPSLILWSQNHDDPRYKALPAWEKWVFWHVMTKDHIWRIPKPWVEGFMFGSLPERFLDYLDQHDPKVFRGGGKAAADALFPPVVPIGMGVVENYGNWSWFKDRPIVPRGLEGVEGRYQATDYSSLTARKLGDVLNYSPAKIDNLIQSFTGGQGVLTVQAVDEVLRHATTLPGGEPPTRTLADVPGLKRFVSRFPNMQAQPIQDFYDRYAKAGQANQTYKMLERTRSDQAEAYAKAHPEVFRMSGLAQVAKGLSANSKLIAGIQRDASLMGDQKRAAIDMLTLESIRAAERVNDLATKPAEPLAAMQERGAQAKDAREQALQSIERGVAEVATGGGNERLRQALQDMARKGAPVSSDDILRRMKSPTFLRQLFTEQLRRAPTPEERERAQNILQSLSQMGQIEALRHLPKSTRPAVLGTP